MQLNNIEFASIIGAVSITGGSGSNFVVADDNVQLIVLGADDDTLAGGGNDTIGSLGGDDILYGNRGDDFISGGADNDTLYGGQDNDSMFGNQDADVLYGNRAADTMYGGQGDDALFGGQEGDALYGNLGADTLAGGRGVDTLVGGTGADAFKFGTDGGIDQASDFSIAEGDRVQVVIDGSGIASIAELAQNLSTDVSGNLVLNLGDGSGLILVGVSAAQAASVEVDLISGGGIIASGTLGGTATSASSSVTAAATRAGNDGTALEEQTGYLAPGEWLF